MGFAWFSFILVVALLVNPLVCELEPNTDGYYVYDFLEKMRVKVKHSNGFGYNFSAPLCSWKGVVCDGTYKYVIGFVTNDLGLSGLIPENTIGKLSKLRDLDLSGNKITGFSSDFWSLGSSLKSLNLSNNEIIGEFSSNVGNFGGLERLDLSFNKFNGSIPESFSSLEALQVLKIDGNGFEGRIPVGISKCRNLVLLSFSGNRISGEVPDRFGIAFPKLERLDMSGNAIHGRFLDISGLKALSYLNISMNLFEDSVMGVFEGPAPLEVIDLRRNQFEGYVPQVNANSSFNWSRLVYLDLSENKLSGQIILDLNEAYDLKHLNLAHNRFSHQAFPLITKLFSLEYLNLSQTSLIGRIPSEISFLTSLTTLDLSDNYLTNHIPDISVKNLRVLDLSRNNLTGQVPFPILEVLHQMQKFNFSFNNLTFCASKFSPETLLVAFIGSTNSCPIAVNPQNIFGGKRPKHQSLKLALAIALSATCFIVGLICLVFGCRRKNRTWAVKQISYKDDTTVSGPFSFQTDSTTWIADVKVATSVPVVIFEKPLLNFTFSDLLHATSNFDRGTLLAEGRFGPVYRGLLPSGIHVAVKVLVHDSTMTDEEAAAELDYLGRIKHPNLVPLTGYCLAGEQRIAIYDYMENGNLQNLLHDLPLQIQAPEDWSTDTWEDDNIQNVSSEGLLTTWGFRHKIAVGTARALAFLHHGCSPPIIHRDVKASSVYLDSNLEPTLSDFGLAKLFGNSLESDITRGSLGYVPPELANPETGSPTPKSDVYGFGVVLLELVTGKKPVGDDYTEKQTSLVSWVRGLVRKNEGSRAIDPKIQDTGSETQMVEALRIGYLCTADLPAKRPSMHQIVGLLKDIQPST